MSGSEYSRREIMLLDDAGVPLPVDTTLVKYEDDSWRYAIFGLFVNV